MSATAASQPRNTYLDFVKGLLIFMVVWGHAIQFVGHAPAEVWHENRFWSDPVFKLIYLFHMPLFIAVSGYLCYHSIQRNTFTGTAVRRFRQLIVPVICWGMIWPLFLAGLAVWRRGASVDPLLFIGAVGQEIATRFWFLWAVFIGTALTALAAKTLRDTWPVFAALSVALLFLPEAGTLPLIKYTVPFFFAGYLLRRHSVDPGAWVTAPRMIGVGAFSLAAWFLWTPHTYVYTSGLQPAWGALPRILFLFLTGALVSVGFLVLAHRLHKVWRPDWVLAFGRRSLDIYIFQTFVFLILHDRPHPLIGAPYFSLLVAPVIALAVCVGCVVAGSVLERLPVLSPALLGRPHRSLPAREGGITCPPPHEAPAPPKIAAAEPQGKAG